MTLASSLLGQAGGTAEAIAAQQAEKQAIALAAQQAEKQTIALAAQQATKLAEEQAAKQARELAAKQASAQVTQLTEAQIAKQAEEQAAKQAEEQVAKQAAEQAAKQSSEQAAENAAKKTSKMTPEDVAKYAAGAAALGLGVYTYAKASDEADASNNTPRGITKIEYDSASSQSVLKITFTPAIRILQGDDLVFSETKTTPVINGPATVKTVVSNSQIIVDFGSTQVVSLQPGGSIKVTTTPGAQAAADVADAAGTAGDTLGDSAGNFLNGLMPDWLKNMGDYGKWALIACCILIVLGLLAFAASKFL